MSKPPSDPPGGIRNERQVNAYLLTAAGFLSFLVFGFIDNLKGPLLPELLRSEGLDYLQGGTLLLASYIGFILATLLTGVMADIVGNRGVLMLAGGSLCAGIGALNWNSSYAMLVLSMSAIGIGLGAIEVGGNGLVVQLHHRARGRYLNLLAMCHGIGSLSVPLYAAWLIHLEMDWKRIYLWAMGLPFLLVLMLLAGRVPQANRAGGGWRWATVFRLGLTAQMGWFYLLIGSYVAMELGLAAWLVEYCQQVRERSVTISNFYLSAFFVLLMLGRLLGSLLVERIGYRTMIATALVGAWVCLGGGVFGPASALWLLPLSGFFMSIVFPTITAAVSELHEANMGSILGLLFAFAGLGGAIGPWTVGLVSQSYGLQVGLASLLLFPAVAILALVVLRGYGSRGGSLG